ncbi:MAG: hypothetical protein WAK31_01980 [Chthoniobacterales bacterium]
MDRKVNLFPGSGIRLVSALCVFGVNLATMASGLGEQPATSGLSTEVKRPINTVVATVPVGSDPYDVVVAPNGQTVYVANFLSNTVSVIDAATNTVIFTVPVGKSPDGLAITPDGSELYVANWNDGKRGTISVVSTANNVVTATLTDLGQGLEAPAMSPDGKSVYVPVVNPNSTNDSSRVTIIDTATNQVSSTPIHIRGHAYHVIFSPSRQIAYVASITYGKPDTFFFSDINTSTQEVLGRTRIKTLPEQKSEGPTLAISPDGMQLYVARAKSIAVFDVTDDKMIQKISAPLTRFTGDRASVTLNGKYLYTPNQFGVVMIDVATDRYVSSCAPNTVPTAVAIAPNGSYAYVSDAINNALVVLDITVP